MWNSIVSSRRTSSPEQRSLWARSIWRFVQIAVAVAGIGAIAFAAGRPAAVSTYTYSKNMQPLGHSARNVPLGNASVEDGIFNSDLAFWGKRAYQGTYSGFRIIDISDPERPIELNDYADCSPSTTEGRQGDLIVWSNILIRSWNSPATATSSCAGQLVGAGFQGLHIFDVTDPLSPELVAAVPLGGPDVLPLEITILTGAAAGQYPAAGARFGTPPPADGLSGEIVAVNDGVEGAGTPIGTLTDGCEPFTVPAGSIALVDRGFCEFLDKAANAEAAGASAMIVVNNVPGSPTALGGIDPQLTITAVMISQAAGASITAAGLPVAATIASDPDFGCGSHTATAVPDLPNNRLVVYSSPSAPGTCDFLDIVEVPLQDPASAQRLKRVDSLTSCHDIGVILGSKKRLACAGGRGARIFSLDPADGAALDTPVLRNAFEIPGVTIGHSASWSWDGEVLIFGHEPGGGAGARCQATSTVIDRTLFFFDADGNQLGTFVHPRPQSNLENCSWHYYNAVPTDRGRFLVSGNYQSGISVIDFTDPANAREIAYADPAPLVDPDPPVGIEVGGDWASYWYNGHIYESDMTRGLTIWKLVDTNGLVVGDKRLDHLNPQAQEFTIPLRRR
jgi:hypothetical protein